MRRFVALALCAFAVLPAVPRAEEPTTERTDPNLPNVPGPFHAFNVTGKYKGRFHSPISEFGLEPMVMLFTRETDWDDALKELLRQIDNVAEKNPAARLHPFLVVQSDDLPEVIGVDSDPAVASKDDDRRRELADKLEAEAAALTLKHVDVLLAGKADLAKYRLDDVDFAFYLFRRDKVVVARTLKKGEKLDDAQVKAVLADLADKGRAPRK